MDDLRVRNIHSERFAEQHVAEAAKLGADVVTLPPNVLKQLITHPLTESGLQAFLDDWKKTGQSIT